jgi:hypothetical protein
VPFLTRTVGVFLVASTLEEIASNATKEDHMMIYTNRIDAADLQRLITYAALHCIYVMDVSLLLISAG